MSSGNEILDTYIFENNSLLEQLESITLDAEELSTLSEENINEVFRIMHTIKGSSAMMEFDSLATVAHRIEDLFFLIRENSMKIVSEANRPALFNIMLQSVDYFRTEMKKIEAEQPLDKNIDSFLGNINSLIAKIQGQDDGGDQDGAAAGPGGQDAAHAGDPNFPYELVVFYDEGCGMENLRAFMLLTSIRDFCDEADLTFQPQGIENDASTAEEVVENGFLLQFKNREDREKAIPIVQAAGSVKSYQPRDYHPPVAEEKPAAPAAEEKPAAPAQATPSASASTSTSTTRTSSIS